MKKIISVVLFSILVSNYALSGVDENESNTPEASTEPTQDEVLPIIKSNSNIGKVIASNSQLLSGLSDATQIQMH